MTKNRLPRQPKPQEKRKLSPLPEKEMKYDLFIKEFLVDFSPTNAARRMGIEPRLGRKYMRDPRLLKLLKAEVDARGERCQVSADYVLTTIKTVVERCQQLTICRTKQGEPIFVTTEEGEKLALVKFDAQAVLKGCELLGKHLKMWTEKFELSITDIENLSNEQLEALSKRLFGDQKVETIQ